MYRTILLAYDGSLEGRLALREGARLAQVCAARVVLLAVVDPTDGFVPLAGGIAGVYIQPEIPDRTDDFQSILDEGFARLTKMGVQAEARLERGEPIDRITEVAKQVSADLVVVGHQKRGMVARWLIGSVAASLTDSLECSLLVARMEIADAELMANAGNTPA